MYLTTYEHIANKGELSLIKQQVFPEGTNQEKFFTVLLLRKILYICKYKKKNAQMWNNA